MRNKREQEQYLRSLYPNYTPAKHDEFVAKYYQECEDGERNIYEPGNGIEPNRGENA